MFKEGVKEGDMGYFFVLIFKEEVQGRWGAF
jgi:hypothetical protein